MYSCCFCHFHVGLDDCSTLNFLGLYLPRIFVGFSISLLPYRRLHLYRNDALWSLIPSRKYVYEATTFWSFQRKYEREKLFDLVKKLFAPNYCPRVSACLYLARPRVLVFTSSFSLYATRTCKKETPSKDFLYLSK